MNDKTIQTLNEHQLLQSINISFDVDYPERIAHYFPTTKSIQLLKKLLDGNRSTSCFVVAPYGSGKSLLGSFYMHVIENKPQVNSVLQPVMDRLKPIDKTCYRAIKLRNKKELKGLSIPLNGYIEDLPQAIYKGIKDSLIRIDELQILQMVSKKSVKTLDDLIDLLSLIRNTYGGNVVDHLDIIWDEFGRHLEELVSRGDAQRLNELQTLSEFATRSKKLSISLVLFLHQSLMRYASNVPRAITDEWKKIEARFETVQYIDDSKEITLLASRVLASLFPTDRPSSKVLSQMISDINDAGLFTELTEVEIHQLVIDSYPVLPAAVHLLPLISSRVAQNERTLFSFLFSLSSNTAITPADIFDYFSDLMRADTSLGGTFHHWLETQNALTKTDNSIQERLIKTLSLLSLGLSGERNRVSKNTLALLAKDYISDQTIKSEIKTLIERKLILPRKNSNSVVLWHGNDIDLRGKIEAEITETYHSFNLTNYINQFLPLEGWRPIEYNIRKNMTRYYRGQGVSYMDLQTLTDPQSLIAEYPADGVILYVIPESEDAINHAVSHIITHLNDPRIVALIPRKIEDLFKVALEAQAIEKLLDDSSLVAEDPLVAPELRLMLDDAQTYLMRIIDKLFIPSRNGPKVICNGVQIESINTKYALRQLLSKNMFDLFPDTPAFNNELINKRFPSRVIVNARKKFILGILDRYGTEDLGLEGNRPDKSMFDTLLIQTKLYKQQKEGHWSFVRADEIDDSYMKNLWMKLENFFANPSETPKSFKILFDELVAPPLGIREGLLPILTAIGFRAFPSAITISGPNGEYIDDIKPTTIEEIYLNPLKYTMIVVALSKNQEQYLNELVGIFDKNPEFVGKETDPIRRCYDGIEAWKATLPPAALISRKFSKPVLRFQRLISRAKNPAQLYLQDFFTAYGLTEHDWEKLIINIHNWKKELEGIIYQYYAAASRSILFTLRVGDESSIRSAGKSWVSILPKNLNQILKDDLARAVIERFSFPYDNDKVLIDSLSSLLIGKRTDRWDDSTITLFDREFKSLIHRIEDEALNAPVSNDEEEKVAVDLLCARIDNLYKKLESIVGKAQALAHIKNLIPNN